ncbi:MAG: hypothetical protein JXR58_11615 [Bacteroidales bacterium]|nr:hypothetical protein [Bacteroidales bacterium]
MKHFVIKNIIISIATMLLLAFVFNSVDYTEEEGFNPSDDGVILAQSFRIINGEIPHKDFISIRPVFSGVMHSIHFFTGLPLQTSARWFVLLENFLTAFFFTMLLFTFFNKTFKNKDLIIFQSILLLIFIFNLNNYTLYPWTTIDALLFSSAGLFFWSNLFKKEKNFKTIVIGLFLICLAALCRQNFAFLAFAAFSTSFIILKKQCTLRKIIICFAFGYLPFILYLVFLICYSAIPEFLTQITGRTELLQTGIFRFIKHFITSPLLVWYFITILVGILVLLKKNISKTILKHSYLVSLGNFVLITIIGILTFAKGPEFLFNAAFDLFWILLFSLLFGTITNQLSILEIRIGFLVLFVAWISSISLGDNTPIFVSGNLLIFGAYYNIKFLASKIKTKNRISAYMLAFTALFFTVFSIYSQKNFNYRDLPSKELSYNLGEVFKEFGGIKTNKNTYEYYREIKTILELHPEMKNSFVILPNNAIIYPITGSRNPFPLDWMQKDEYIGSEEEINEMIEELLKTRKLLILVEKIDSKKLHEGKNEIVFPMEKFSYKEIIYKNTQTIPEKYYYFELRIN